MNKTVQSLAYAVCASFVLAVLFAAPLAAQDDWGWGEPDSGEDSGSQPPPAEEGWEGGEWEDPGGPGPQPSPVVEIEEGPRRSGRGPKSVSISAWIVGVTPIGGDAGSGNGAPSWTDAYGFGFGGGAAFSLRILPCLGGRAALYYQSFASKTFTSGGVDNELSDFSYFGLSLGPRFYFLIDRPVDAWFRPDSRPYLGLIPFAGIDFGIGFSSAVTWDVPPPAWDYWESGTILVQEIVVGLEYRFAESIGMEFELGYGTTGAPPAASGVASPMNEAGSPTLFRFRLGLLFAF